MKPEVASDASRLLTMFVVCCADATSGPRWRESLRFPHLAARSGAVPRLALAGPRAHLAPAAQAADIIRAACPSIPPTPPARLEAVRNRLQAMLQGGPPPFSSMNSDGSKYSRPTEVNSTKWRTRQSDLFCNSPHLRSHFRSDNLQFLRVSTAHFKSEAQDSHEPAQRRGSLEFPLFPL